MTYVIAFTAASFVASALVVVSACVLSSRLSQEEGVKEFYANMPKASSATTEPATPFSLN